MRCTINKPVIIDTLHQFECVHSIYNCGMISEKGAGYNACSPDIIALLNYPIGTVSDFE